MLRPGAQEFMTAKRRIDPLPAALTDAVPVLEGKRVQDCDHCVPDGERPGRVAELQRPRADPVPRIHLAWTGRVRLPDARGRPGGAVGRLARRRGLARRGRKSAAPRRPLRARGVRRVHAAQQGLPAAEGPSGPGTASRLRRVEAGAWAPPRRPSRRASRPESP